MFELPPLPYPHNGLEPYISEKTLSFHYGKHHQTYVNKLNELITNTDQADKTLEEIIKTAEGPLFNNAAQVWNHTFYWENLSDTHHQKPQGPLLIAIEETFGSLDEFQTQFTAQALSLFGSGWAWLVITDGKLSITQTSNAETPLTSASVPILTCDVWEHAYYLDTQNKRPDYLKNFWEVLNWETVQNRYLEAVR